MSVRRWRCAAALVLALASVPGGAGAADPVREPRAGGSETGVTQAKPVAPTKKDKDKPQAAPAAAPLNGLAQAARNAGVVDCVGRIQQVSEFLTKGSKSAAFLFVAPAEVNRHGVSASLEVQPGGVASYASASFAPVGTDGCGALYETVSYWANACEDVAKVAFAGLSAAGKLGDHIAMLDGGANLRVFLMPVAQGCLAIKKELVF